MKLHRGDRVLIMIPRIREWWAVMLACDLLGIIASPATRLLTQEDLRYRVQSCDPKAIITTPERAHKFAFFDGIRICIGGSYEDWIDFDSLFDRASEQFTFTPIPADDPSLLYFTSATGGSPKMVLHTHTSYSWAHRLTGGLWLDLRPGELICNISDMGWGKAAWSNLFGPWGMGAGVFALHTDNFQPQTILRAISKYPVTHFCAPPTTLRLLTQQSLHKYKFSHLRHCVSAGEPLTSEIVQNWKSATGLDIYEGYGQTETVVLIANVRSRQDSIRIGSMGKPIPGYDIRLIDDDYNLVPQGTEGNIAIHLVPERPLGLFKEYFKAPEQTAKAFGKEWYLTGDRAVMDEDGYYWFRGRNDDLIKSTDFRIGPAEVENTLLLHPAVQEVAVIGKPDKIRGQIVKAFIVLNQGFTPSSELTIELQKHCCQYTAIYKRPKEIEYIETLPRNASGKIRRVDLRNLEKQRALSNPTDSNKIC